MNTILNYSEIFNFDFTFESKLGLNWTLQYKAFPNFIFYCLSLRSSYLFQTYRSLTVLHLVAFISASKLTDSILSSFLSCSISISAAKSGQLLVYFSTFPPRVTNAFGT